MGTAERRLLMLKHLCRVRHTTLSALAEEFSVSIRTVQRDLFELEMIFRLPLSVRRGRGGGVSVDSFYSPLHTDLTEDELSLLQRLSLLARDLLAEKERECLAGILKKYSPKR